MDYPPLQTHVKKLSFDGVFDTRARSTSLFYQIPVSNGGNNRTEIVAFPVHVVVPYLEPHAAAISTSGFVFTTSFRRNEESFTPDRRKGHRNNLGTVNLGIPHEHLAQAHTNNVAIKANPITELVDRVGSHMLVRQGVIAVAHQREDR